MHHPRKVLLAGVTTTVILIILGVQFGWFTGEPTYRGRTVSAWLNRLTVYDAEAGVSTNGDRWVKLVPRPAQTVTNDPAYRALMVLGTKAVPVLIQRVKNPAEWGPEVSGWSRMKQWLEWKWKQLRGVRTVRRPAPRAWPRNQLDRKTTAGVVLLALGTNAQAGFPAYALAYADAPKHLSLHGTPVPGAPVGLSSSDVVHLGKVLLPQRQDELAAGILESLQHSNAWCRAVALEVTREYPEALPRWRDLLLKLTLDEDMMVRETALGRLMLIAQDQRLSLSIPHYQIELAADAVLKDARTDVRVGRLARTVRDVARSDGAEPERVKRFLRTVETPGGIQIGPR